MSAAPITERILWDSLHGLDQVCKPTIVFQIISSHREPLPEDCLIRNWNAGQYQQRRSVGGMDTHLRSLWKHVAAIELHREAVIVVSWVVHGWLLVRKCTTSTQLGSSWVRGMKKWTLARRSQRPINISACICIDQMCRLTVAIYPIVCHCLALMTFQRLLCRNLELARLVTDPRDARRRSSALFNQIRFTGPLQLTRLGMSILSLYCTSYTCESILTVLKAIGRLDNGCDSRDFLFGRTIIDTKRRGGEGSGRISAASCLFASFGNLWSRRFRRPFTSFTAGFFPLLERSKTVLALARQGTIDDYSGQ